MAIVKSTCRAQSNEGTWAESIAVIVLPVIGVFFIRNQTGIYPPEDRSESASTRTHQVVDLQCVLLFVSCCLEHLPL